MQHKNTLLCEFFFQFNMLVNLLPQIKEAWCLGYDKGFQSNLALFSVNTI